MIDPALFFRGAQAVNLNPGLAWRRWLLLPVVAVVLVFCVGLTGCSSKPEGGRGLLAGKTPSRTDGVLHPERLNDGFVPPGGSAWDSNRTAVFTTQRSLVEYDLGEVHPIESAFLLGDNNDEYEVAVSEDGKNFQRAWLAPRSPRPGVQWRQVSGLGKSGRYIRISPRTGDRALSIAEVSVHTEQLGAIPPFQEASAEDLNLRLRNALILFGTAVLLAVTFAGAGSGVFWNLVMFLVLGAGTLHLGQIFMEAYPTGELEVSLARGVAAAIGVGVVARETYSRRFAPHRALNIVALGLAAVLAIAAFFNLGKPQFYDDANKEPSVVHNYDMRVYFPVAKYFKELKYDGLYLASVLSYAEEHGGLQLRRIQDTELRDLRDHRMRKVSEVMPEVEAIRARFSDSRWEEFKADMSYFWKTMGSGGYLGSMRDHGGNATPVWLTIAYLMFKSAPASNEVLLWGGMLDPLLLLVFAIAVWRSFGVRTALVSLIVFGANDFYMFGSNWAGATLRNDWMVYLGLGACALHTGRFRLGGALLAFSALIRAFPAISLLALGIPVSYYLVGYVREYKALPSLKALVEEQRWFFQTVLGATMFVALAVGLSSVILGPDCWPLWVKKISSFTASPHVNHISLLTLTSGSEGNQHAVQMARLPLHAAATVLYLGLAVWACFRKPPHVAALLGILMMPVLMYPANYYIHFVFLLPLLVREPLAKHTSRFAREAEGKVWMLVLGLCAAQYFTVRETALDMHFYNASVLLMAATLGILVFLLPRSREGLILIPFLDTQASRALVGWAPGGRAIELAMRPVPEAEPVEAEPVDTEPVDTEPVDTGRLEAEPAKGSDKEERVSETGRTSDASEANDVQGEASSPTGASGTGPRDEQLDMATERAGAEIADTEKAHQAGSDHPSATPDDDPASSRPTR